MISGLKTIRTIQLTDRFEAFEAELKGQKVFAKKALVDKTRELLARVPENSKLADRMGLKTNFKFRTPKVIAKEGDWLVTEWIEGESLNAELEQNIQAVADTLVNFLKVLDAEPVKDSEVRKTFKSDSLSAYMIEKLPKNLSASHRRTIDQAKQLFDRLQPKLVPSWQDGDIKPEHIFKDPDNNGQFVLIDPEHFDPRWPRFYSLANNYAKYYVRQPKEFSYTLLKSFIGQSGLEAKVIFEPLIASIIVRGISLHWEVDYDPGAEHYNIPRAQEMLKLCLAARRLDDLY